MKIFGDLHLGLSLSYYDSYPEYIREKFYEILGDDREFISTGDTFHNAGSYSEELLSIALYTHWFPIGNGKHAHDVYRQRRTYEEMFYTEGLHTINGKKVFFQGSLSDNEIDNFDYESVPECDIIITHNFITEVFNGCKHLNWEKLKEKCRILIAGHYHRQEDIADGVYYIGSFVNTDFGSANERGRYFDLDKEEFVYFDIIQFKTYYDENVKVPDGVISRLKTSEPPSLENRGRFNLVSISSKEDLNKEVRFDAQNKSTVLSAWEDFAEEKEIIELGKKYLEDYYGFSEEV